MLEQTYLELNSRMATLKTKLLDYIDEFIVNELQTEDGFIKRDASQIPKFQKSMILFFELHVESYLAFMASSIDKLLKDAARNFKEDGAIYNEVDYMKGIMGIKGNTIEKKRNGQPTVLYAIASMAVIKTDVINKMQGAFIGDTSMKDFRKAVKNSVSRKYHDFFEVNSVAALFNVYNAANRFFAKKYNYKKFRYEGGLIADSRDFCIERDGLEFFVEDGEAWNDLEWQGKMPGVDFFVQVGGYNCRHWLTYIKE